MPIAEDARQRLQARISYLQSAGSLVIDADTHPSDLSQLPAEIAARMRESPNYFHGKPISAEQLIAEMDLAKVDGALCWQNPAATAYGDDEQENFEALLAANAYIYDAAGRYPTRIYPAGWTDPKALGLERALRLIDNCVDDFGFPIVKLNPAQNGYPIDSPPVLACVDRIVERGAVPAFHYGADTPYTPPEGFAVIARRHPDKSVIGVHMGGGGAGYVEGERHAQQSRRLLHELPNIFFIESAKRDTHIESDLIDATFEDGDAWRRIAVASDAPYGRVAWNFGGYRLMLETLSSDTHADPRIQAQPDRLDAIKKAAFLGCNAQKFILAVSKDFLAANA